jgi:hypothetical protein
VACVPPVIVTRWPCDVLSWSPTFKLVPARSGLHAKRAGPGQLAAGAGPESSTRQSDPHSGDSATGDGTSAGKNDSRLTPFSSSRIVLAAACRGLGAHWAAVSGGVSVDPAKECGETAFAGFQGVWRPSRP